MDLISIIVPVYGVEKWLDQCVQSMRNQTYENLEILLVDDGSLDHCPQMCDDYAKMDSRIRVIHKKNGGQGSARNVALDQAKGNYIMFVDSDDWLALDICQSLYDALKAYDADMAISGFYYVTNHSIYEEDCVADHVQVYDHMEALAIYYQERMIYPAPWCKLYKRELWDDIRFPVNTFREDEYIFYRVLAKSKKTVHTGAPKYYYNIRQGSAENSSFGQRNFISNVSIDLQYEFMMEHYPQLHELVWDTRIKKRVMQIRDMTLAGKTGEFAKEYEEQLRFLRENKAYDSQLQAVCQSIIRKGSRHFYPMILQRKIRKLLIDLHLFNILRETKRFLFPK